MTMLQRDRLFVRSFPLDDISVRAEGDGRTVEAYAAVFNRPVQVSDWEGDYEEIIDPAAFNATVAKRRNRFAVLFNHGTDMYGVPSDRYSMPLGRAVEVKPDSKGLWTVTRYAATPLADEVLALINDGAITGQSFGGTWVRSDWTDAKTSMGAAKKRTVRRMEIALRDYGPCTFPVYEDARIVGVRSADQIAALVAQWSPEERAALTQLLAETGENPEPDSSPDSQPNPDASPGAESLAPVAQELDLLRAHLSKS